MTKMTYKQIEKAVKQGEKVTARVVTQSIGSGFKRFAYIYINGDGHEVSIASWNKVKDYDGKLNAEYTGENQLGTYTTESFFDITEK